MFQAFVLAAGLGTRLRPLTEVVPKPLVPVCGVPLLAWSLALAARHGLREVVVNAHWLAPQIEAWAGEREGCRVTVVTEPELLGTGGGLAQVADRMAPRFAVLNADVLHDVDLATLVTAVPAGGAAMALRSAPDAHRYGLVTADRSGRIVRLVDVARATPDGPVADDTHFTGIHAMDRASLAHIPPGLQCVVRTAYRALVPERRVSGIRYDGPWLDAGDPSAYLDANLDVLCGRARFTLDPFPRAGWARDAEGRTVGDPSLVAGAQVVGPAWIGRGARIGRGATLTRCVIGAGAVVPPGVSLTDTVLWDHATVDGDGIRRIAWPGGQWVG